MVKTHTFFHDIAKGGLFFILEFCSSLKSPFSFFKNCNNE